MAFHLVQQRLMSVNLASQVSMLRQRVQVVVWSVPRVALVLITVLLRMYLVLSADTIVLQVKQTVLLAHRVNMAHTKEPLYVWIVRRGNLDLEMVALLLVNAKIVLLASLAPQVVFIHALLVASQNISPRKDNLHVSSAKA